MRFGKDTLTEIQGDHRLGEHRDSEYLGAEDIAPGKEPILTISGIYNGMVTLQRGKENKDVVAFKEPSVPGLTRVRPLVVNATNRKTLRKLFGDTTGFALVGKRIQLYVDHRVRNPEDGGFTDGVRIKPFVPAEVVVPPCSDCGGVISGAFGHDSAWMAEYTKRNYGSPLCAECAKKRKAAQEPQDSQENEG